MNAKNILLVVLLSAAVSFATASFVDKPISTENAKKETKLEQVKRTGVIRCGYITWPPFLIKDPVTGKLGGAGYDIMEEVGKQLNLKIDWASEVSTSQMLADLAMNRFDMICLPISETPNRAREGAFSIPAYYAYVNLYVRKDDTRFDNDIERANQPDITLATIDGAVVSTLAAEYFPKAKRLALPEYSSGSDLFMNVASNKADATVDDPHTFDIFDANNRGLLREASGKPLLYIGASFPLPANEPSFKSMIDSTLAYLHNSGFIDRVLKKYDRPIKFIRPAKPYQE